MIFRNVHLKSHTIGITREIGYPEESHLDIVTEYLAFQNRVDFGGQLRTSSSTEGEKKITMERDVRLPLVGGSGDFHTLVSRKRKRRQPLFDTERQKFKVDRYYEGDVGNRPRVIKFKGCLWHGCIDCYSPDTHLPFGDKTMCELYAKQKRK